MTSTGLFAGADAAICDALGLKGVTQLNRLKQRTTYREIARRYVSRDDLVGLTRRLFRLMSSNLSMRKPSDQNWRWERQIETVNCKNTNPEVVIERAIAFLAEQGSLLDEPGRMTEWCNQIPVASGLINDRLHKRAAVDLAKISGDELDLYELKWNSDTPVYAAFEILQYGLAYLLCRSKFPCDDRKTMKVNTLGLNVLAPVSYYRRKKEEDLDLMWLQAGLSAGVQAVAREELKQPNFRASFRFVIFPLLPESLFANVADAKERCEITPLEPKAAALVKAMSELRPAYPPSASV